MVSTCKGVNPLTKEECVLKRSSRRVPPQPVGGVERAPEEQSHQRDGQVVVRASDGERDHVKSYMPKAWTEEGSTRARQLQCMKLSSDILSTKTVSDEANDIGTVFNNPTKQERHHHRL